MKPSVKILLGYHKKDVLFKDDIFTPIHLGRALAKERNNESDPKYRWLLENMIGDDTGDNISIENSYYNELTGVYWAWKNYEKLGNPDYIGFMHYRRHFIFRKMPGTIDVELNHIDDNYYEVINYCPESVFSLLNSKTIVFHGGIVDSIYKHYSDNHEISQLDDALEIIDNETPKLSKTAHKYMSQKWGSFCNMFILPKNVFFDYCEWLFKILKIYVSTHDLAGRRLFISERLTGIYFQYLIDQGYEYIDLPIALLNESIEVPIVILWENNTFDVATLILSHTKERLDSTKIHFYIIGKVADQDKHDLTILTKENNLEIDFVLIDTQYSKDFSGKKILLLLPELLPNINKVVFMTTKVLCNKDCGEFFRTANVDDYWALGLPNDKKISADLMVLSLKKLRNYDIIKKYLAKQSDITQLEDILIDLCGAHIGILPYWMYTEAETTDRAELFDKNESRGDCQYKSKWTTYTHYNSYDPRYTIQGIYSLAWWDIASKVPGYITKSTLDIGKQWDSLVEQQKRINEGCIPKLHENKNHHNDKKSNRLNKAYKQYGLKETFRLGIKHLKGAN